MSEISCNASTSAMATSLHVQQSQVAALLGTLSADPVGTVRANDSLELSKEALELLNLSQASDAKEKTVAAAGG